MIKKIKTRLGNGAFIPGYKVSSGGFSWKTTSYKEALRFSREMKRRRKK